MQQHIDVLLIDDDPDICFMLKTIISNAGYTVQYITRIELLDQKLKDIHPRLIFMDMFLSGKDGTEICKELRKDESSKSIRIVMMSAHPDAENNCRNAGADDFMAKPFDIDHLLQKVKMAMQ